MCLATIVVGLLAAAAPAQAAPFAYVTNNGGDNVSQYNVGAGGRAGAAVAGDGAPPAAPGRRWR